MRTNKLFLAAAMLAAGVIGASAQSNVYSLNIVGYINVPLAAGQTKLVANQLNVSPTNQLRTVITPTAGVNYFFNKFNPATGGFFYQELVDGIWGGDGDADGSVSFNPGEAMYINASEATTITFVGEVVQISTNNIRMGLSTVGAILPQAGNLEALGFPATGNFSMNQQKTWPATGFVYSERIDGNWNGDLGETVVPTVQVAEGFFVDNSSGAVLPWVRSFTP